MDISSVDGVTPEIELPSETAYASIMINQANNKVMRKTQEAEVSKKRLFGFGVSTFLVSVGMSVVTLFAFSNIFGGLFRETFARKMVSTGWIFIFPTIISAVCIAVACYSLFLRNSKR